ncbi:MAG: MHS family MFS transporter [Phreatobacter sp.]|uniref:MFS transporter n=1 Tax=Phreatobacter sp. TaxID=1966341 RepID=UPI001A49E8DB|nr:MFS transporter [Phreatobacter sp.]MBL8568245.1 MHS family MFS transporter [Phreatobacter sp.]
MSMSTASGAGTTPRPMTKEERKVILASSLGTVFEWYDFYLYGSLAVMIGAQFFAPFDANTRAIFALLAFAAGFLVRPFGALVFGRLGDLVGRKYTFLVTIVIMGASTFLVGLLPSYATIGWLAPVILIALRMAQGLALGGEYGGAAVYVAEHAPPGQRGYYTSFIQTTATVGLLLSLIVILTLRLWMGEAQFAAWGWRVPFLLSIFLLAISVWIRLQMNESPAFKKMKEEGTHSKAPLSEAFGQWKNAKIALLALIGGTAGQAVVWYTGQFYALFFLQSILRVDLFTANVLIAWSLVLGTGFFIVFGALSDRIGRKPIILAGCLIAAVTYFPLFTAMTKAANPALARAHEQVKVVLTADPAGCGNVFNPVGTRVFTAPCDVSRVALANAAIKYDFVNGPAGSPATVTVNGTAVPIDAQFAAALGRATQAAGYPAAGNAEIIKVNGFFSALGDGRALWIIGILFILVIYVTMVYGPIAALLVELFPTRIRYTAMSLPYHIGNGWFGGLLPATSFAMVAATGDIYYGLWYPIIFAMMTFVVGLFFLPETKDRDIFTYDGNK